MMMSRSDVDLNEALYHTLVNKCTILWGKNSVHLDGFLVITTVNMPHPQYAIWVGYRYILQFDISGFIWKSTEYAADLGIGFNINIYERVAKTNEFIQQLIDLSIVSMVLIK